MKKEEVVLSSKLFIDITREEYYELDSRIEKQRKIEKYFKGDIIIGDGDTISSIRLILSGEVDVMRIFPEGEFVYVNTLRAKDIIGVEFAYRRGHNSFYFFRAETDVELYSIPLSYILEKGHIDEEVRIKLMNNISVILTYENIRNYGRLDILAMKGLRERICIYLEYQSRHHKSNTFEIPFNREKMADYLCVNRTALSNELSKMKKEGLIDFKKNRFTLL